MLSEDKLRRFHEKSSLFYYSKLSDSAAVHKNRSVYKPENTSQVLKPLPTDTSFAGKMVQTDGVQAASPWTCPRFADTCPASHNRLQSAESGALDELDACFERFCLPLNPVIVIVIVKPELLDQAKNLIGRSTGHRHSVYAQWWAALGGPLIPTGGLGYVTMEVPSNIQTQWDEDGQFRCCEPPIYVNQIYPWL